MDPTPFARTYALETILATLMVTCGLTLAWDGDTFLLPHYNYIRGYIPEFGGGLFLAVVGAIRLWGILKNGGHKYSPVLRMGGCAIGGGFWLSMAVTMKLEVLFDNARIEALGPPLLLPIAFTLFLGELVAITKGAEDANSQDSFHIRQNRSKVGMGNGRVS